MKEAHLRAGVANGGTESIDAARHQRVRDLGQIAVRQFGAGPEGAVDQQVRVRMQQILNLAVPLLPLIDVGQEDQ